MSMQHPGHDLSHLIGPSLKSQALKQTLMSLAQSLMAAVIESSEQDDEAAGLAVYVLREQNTGRILSIHLTPVDMVDGESVPRYNSAEQVSSH